MRPSPLADQLLAAMREVHRLHGANEHLVEDERIGELVEKACNGRQTDAFHLLHGVNSPVEARVRVLPAEQDAPARLPDQPVTEHPASCSRCGWSFNAGEEAAALGLSLPGDWDGKRHVLWIPAGAAIIEFTLCTSCATYLESDFRPVQWLDGHVW